MLICTYVGRDEFIVKWTDKTKRYDARPWTGHKIWTVETDDGMTAHFTRCHPDAIYEVYDVALPAVRGLLVTTGRALGNVTDLPHPSP